MNSFVMLSKNIRSWELFHDHLCVNMYIHLLTLAAWRERKIDPFCLHPGEVLTSQSLLQEELLIGRQEVRKTLEKLEKSGAVKIVLSNNYGTIIKVNNFKDSEVFSDYTGTRWQPATNQQKTSLKVDTTYNI